MLPPKKTILLTAGFLSSLAMVLAAADSAPEAGAAPGGSPSKAALPAEIVQAEADYEVRQQAIDKAMRQASGGTAGRPAEERREIFFNWMREQRPALEEQARYSAEIDALYTANGLDPAPPADLPEEGESQRPLRSELQKLSRTHAGDSEALRAARFEWMKINREALKEEDRMTKQRMAGELSAGRMEESEDGAPAPAEEDAVSGEEKGGGGRSRDHSEPPRSPERESPVIDPEVLARAPEEAEARRAFLHPLLERAKAERLPPERSPHP